MPRPIRLPKSAQKKMQKYYGKTDQKMKIKIQKFSWPFRITYKLFKSILKILNILLKIKIHFLDLFSYDFSAGRLADFRLLGQFGQTGNWPLETSGRYLKIYAFILKLPNIITFKFLINIFFSKLKDESYRSKKPHFSHLPRPKSAQ